MNIQDRVIIPGQKVLIVGNGFDLDLGLKTQFSDFANSDFWPFNAPSEIYGLENYLYSQKKCQKWLDLEKSLETYATTAKYASKALSNIKAVRAAHGTLLDKFMLYLRHELDHSQIRQDSVAAGVLRAIIENGYYDSIYSFNYTSLSELAEKLGINMLQKAVHIHGELRNNSAILGFNEKVDVDDKLKFLYKTFSPYYSSNSLRHDLYRAEEVVIFGHSLGSVDYSYFDEFFKSMVTDSKYILNRRKVTIFTYDEYSKLDILIQLRNMNEKNTDLLYGLNDFNIIYTKNPDSESLKAFYNHQGKHKKGTYCITTL